jgi:hypothetical protein
MGCQRKLCGTQCHRWLLSIRNHKPSGPGETRAIGSSKKKCSNSLAHNLTLSCFVLRRGEEAHGMRRPAIPLVACDSHNSEVTSAFSATSSRSFSHNLSIHNMVFHPTDRHAEFDVLVNKQDFLSFISPDRRLLTRLVPGQ